MGNSIQKWLIKTIRGIEEDKTGTFDMSKGDIHTEILRLIKRNNGKIYEQVLIKKGPKGDDSLFKYCIVQYLKALAMGFPMIYEGVSFSIRENESLEIRDGKDSGVIMEGDHIMYFDDSPDAEVLKVGPVPIKYDDDGPVEVRVEYIGDEEK